MEKDLKTPIKVRFDRIHLDPNNPRIAPRERVGYADPEALFDPERQRRVRSEIDPEWATTLESAIVAQGWVPIDAMMVWEHPEREGSFVVVEGNTRAVVLARIRDRIADERKKLARMEEKKGFTQEDVDTQRQLVAQLEQVIADTDDLLVYPVNAPTPAELERRLPRLLGVRHITHSKQWSPYATNLYIRSLYEEFFREQHGDEVPIALKTPLIKRVAAKVSLKETKTRQNIQAASAFSHFKAMFEDRLPPGEEFTDEDQYFFELLLQNKYPREQLGFGKDDLQLPPEREEVLFKWAFEKPRKGSPDANKFRIAEDIRLWNQMRTYDTRHQTDFASRLDVDDPDAAPSMADLEVEYLRHKNEPNPVVTISGLIRAFNEMKFETIESQASHLKPMLEELAKKVQSRLKYIDSMGE